MGFDSSTSSSKDAGVEQYVTVLLILLVIIHIAYTAPQFSITLCRSLSRQRLKGLCQTVPIAWRRTAKRACNCLRVGSPLQKDPMDVYVSYHMNAFRLSSLKALAYYGQWIFGAVALYILRTNLYRLYPRSNTMLQDVTLIASYALMLLLSRRPSLLTAGTTDMWYSVFMLLLAQCIASAREEQIHVYISACMTAQLVVSFAYLKLRICLFWNAAVCVAFAIWVTDYGVQNGLGNGTKRVLLSLILYSASLCVVLRSLELHMEEQLRNRLDAIATRNEHSAARAVLNCVCDVVVELNEHLQLVEHSARLADMLFLAPSRNLQGVQLQEFMPQRHDQHVFTENMKRKPPDDEGGMAATFHLHMQDSDHNTIPMEFFSVQFDGIDQQSRFMVGIREWTDVSPVAALPDTALRFEAQPCPNAQTSFSNSATRPSSVAPVVCGNIEDCSDHWSHSYDTLTSGCITPLCPGHGLTIEKAKQHSLLLAIEGWNVLTPPSHIHCCTYHATVREAFQTITRLLESPCNQSFYSCDGDQCPSCGIFGIFDRKTSKCSMCKIMKEEPRLDNAKVAETRYDQFEAPTTNDKCSSACYYL